MFTFEASRIPSASAIIGAAMALLIVAMAGCVEDDGTEYEVDNDNPEMFSVYAHLVDGGVECIGDFATVEMAAAYADEVNVQYGNGAWPVYNYATMVRETSAEPDINLPLPTLTIPEALQLALDALNTAPRFEVPYRATDSYAIASQLDRIIKALKG